MEYNVTHKKKGNPGPVPFFGEPSWKPAYSISLEAWAKPQETLIKGDPQAKQKETLKKSRLKASKKKCQRSEVLSQTQRNPTEANPASPTWSELTTPWSEVAFSE